MKINIPFLSHNMVLDQGQSNIFPLVENIVEHIKLTWSGVQGAVVAYSPSSLWLSTAYTYNHNAAGWTKKYELHAFILSHGQSRVQALYINHTLCIL